MRKIRFHICELGVDSWDTYEYALPKSMLKHAIMIGRGYAFTHDWSMDGSQSKLEIYNPRTEKWEPF